ncbi:hypothetical protein TKK_0003338 [Trichogramma kaykai]
MLGTLKIVPDENLLVRILESALPNTVRSKWEETLSLNQIPTLNEIYTFVSETAFKYLTIAQNTTSSDKPSNPNNKRSANNQNRGNDKRQKLDKPAQAFVTNTSTSCPACSKENHPLYLCRVFREAHVQYRWDVVKKSNVCRNCLKTHTGECSCPRCKRCSSFHNTLLCNQQPPKNSNNPKANL